MLSHEIYQNVANYSRLTEIETARLQTDFQQIFKTFRISNEHEI